MKPVPKEINDFTALYINAYRKATPTTRGLSFLPEDKWLLGKAIWEIVDGPRRREFNSQGFYFVNCVIREMVKTLNNGEKKCTISSRLSLWRLEHSRKVEAAKKLDGGVASIKESTQRVVSVLPSTTTEAASVSSSSLELEFKEKIELERKKEYFLFLKAEQVKCQSRLSDISRELNRLDVY